MNHGVLCQKIVTSAEVNVDDLKLPKLSSEVQTVIRDAKVESLQGLLGPDSEKLMRKLVAEYWK